MIKAVIFDLDGVLIDADKWHFEALNEGLVAYGYEPISWMEHLTIYKGIPTKKKLEILEKRKGVYSLHFNLISKWKQAITEEIIETSCKPVPEKVEMMRLLQGKYRTAVCSNAIRSSVRMMLERSGLMPYVDFYLSNEDVKISKPNPEMYLKAFEKLHFAAEECMIVEDSDVGYKAAIASGGVLLPVSGPDEVNYYRIITRIRKSDRINIIIPAAGQGKRFAEAGYVHPKPFIDVEGQPMVDHVLKNFVILNGQNIMLMQKTHIDQYCAEDVFPECKILPVNGLTEGAACTVLLAEDLIDNNSELIIANSDQYVEASMDEFVWKMQQKNADAGILTFTSKDPKWSYAKYDRSGQVSEVAEKVVISDQATVGIYYYKHGKDFVKYAKQMIAKNIRVNNEFYVCPVFNEFLADGKRIFIHQIKESKMHGLGTPEDLRKFLKRNWHV